MIALSVAKLKMFSPERQFFSLNKAKKEKQIVESLDQCRLLKVRKKARNVFCFFLFFFVMSLRLSGHKVLHNMASSSIFFSISLGPSRFFRLLFVLQIFGV